ncbi:MAG: rubrerythrin [bacterium]
MKELKGSKTEKNLHDAFAGESMARNKYTYFASVAKKEGYEQIAGIFLETAENEKEHAKLHFKALSGIGTTTDNLKAAADGENFETKEMYPKMAAEAREEGFEEIAKMFEAIGSVEKDHETRYRKLLDSVEKKVVFKNAKKVYWKCRNCGHIHEGTEAPDICPVCKHPKAFFELFVENY